MAKRNGGCTAVVFCVSCFEHGLKWWDEDSVPGPVCLERGALARADVVRLFALMVVVLSSKQAMACVMARKMQTHGLHAANPFATHPAL